MSLSPGARLGPYEIVAALGAGGMGEVFRARDTRLDRIVAIKILPETLAADPHFRERFDREARAISQLTHPHICTLFDVGEERGTAFLVMEHLDGETLADRLTKGALPLDDALKVAIQIADALAAAHRHGIVHRDLKPGNVMLTKAGAKLLDFGLAKATGVIASAGLSMLPTTPPNLTAQGTILGTFQYMTPEQLEGQDADARSDIFAFGALLYEMLTGRKAFEGRSQATLSAAILERVPPPITTTQPLTPRVLEHIVTRCLAKHPDERWQSASDVARELQWVAQERDVAVEPRAGTARARWRERVAWTVAVIAMVTAGALAISTVVRVRDVRPEPMVTRFDFATPATTEPFSFALSPDGRQIVFVAIADGGSKLWLRRLDQTDARPIAGTERASAPFWAPDGRALGFFADAKLKRIDLAGGAPQVIADAPAARGGTWNRDGVIVFASGTEGLRQVGAAGGVPTDLTRRTHGQTAQWWPQFLPDGRRFLFYAPGSPDTRGEYIGSLDGGDPRRVLAADTAAVYAPPGYLLVVAQGALVARRFDAARGIVSGDPLPIAPAVGSDANNRVAVAASTSDVMAHRAGAASRRQLVWFNRAGKALGVLVPPEDTSLSYVELAPDGRHVAVLRIVQGNNDVWLVEVDRSLTSRFTFDPANDAAPLWSPDGRRVVFRSSRNGHYDIFDKAADGAAEEQPLLITTHDKMPQAWSPDGRFLLYAVQDPNTQSDLWALPLFGDRKPFPVVQTSFDDVQGQFSPDGQWMAYASNESGRYEVYVRPFAGTGAKWQVSTGGGTFPRWRRDGKELFYVAPDNRMMAAPIQVAADRRTASAGAAVALFPTRLTTGNVGIGGYSSRAQYAVAADGRFLLNVNVDDAVASPITIVLNWQSALEAREKR